MFHTLYQVFLAPLLETLGLHKTPDPTWGRYVLEPSGWEKDLTANKRLDVQTRRRRVFLLHDGSAGPGEDITLTETELRRGRGKRWIHYQVWTSPTGKGGPADGCDIIMIHGKHRRALLAYRWLIISLIHLEQVWVTMEVSRETDAKGVITDRHVMKSILLRRKVCRSRRLVARGWISRDCTGSARGKAASHHARLCLAAPDNPLLLARTFHWGARTYASPS